MFNEKVRRIAQLSEAAARTAARSLTALTVICGMAAIAHAQSSTVANTDGAFGLVSSTGNLYWTSNSSISEFGPPPSSTIWRAAKTNAPGNETILWTEQESAGTSITFGNIVWANPGAFFGYFVATYTDAAGNTVSKIKRVPLAGGFADILAASPDVVVNGDLVTDGTTLFWADRSGIRSVSVTGGPVITLFFGFGLGPLSLDSSNVYFSQGAAIHRILKNGSAGNIVVTAPGTVTALHADVTNGRVYWGEHGGFVRSIFGGGGSITTYQGAQALRQVTSVGFDGSRVLWTDCAVPGFNQCMVKKWQNGTTTVVSQGSVGAGHLQWDTASIYWTDISGVRRFIQR